MAPLRIGIAGLGNVGGGTVSILQKNAEMIAARCGRSIVITAVSMRDTSKKRDLDLTNIRIEPDALQLAGAKDVDVVVELIGGEEGAARTLVENALANGKHVVTANKALVARHGLALATLAENHQVTFAFEGAVAGGIPIIASLRQGLAANRIARVAGILNGTCNYILTTMQKDGRDFADVLKEAQALGYAEAEPSIDIDGHDTAHKLAILASLAFGTIPKVDAVAVVGIRQISLADIKYAETFGYRIKLLGLATMENGKLLQRVQPCLVPKTSPLGMVDGPFNAVEIEGDAVGKVFQEGRGAGAGPTGSAVVSDLMSIARGDRSPAFILPCTALASVAPAPSGGHQGAYYLRFNLENKAGVLAGITAAFGDEGISVRAMQQPGIAGDGSAQVVIITEETSEAAIGRAKQRIAALGVTRADPVMLQVEDERSSIIAPPTNDSDAKRDTNKTPQTYS